MKCAIVLVLACAVAAQAQPFLFPGFLGRLLGLGSYGNYANGGGYGNNLYNRGMGGQGQQGWLNNGMDEFHNIGGHNRRVSNIQQAEDNGFHNIGSEGAMTNGGMTANGFGNYDNGASGFGSNFGLGGGGMMMR